MDRRDEQLSIAADPLDLEGEEIVRPWCDELVSGSKVGDGERGGGRLDRERVDAAVAVREDVRCGRERPDGGVFRWWGGGRWDRGGD